MNKIFKTIKERHSTRAPFESKKPVSRDDIRLIVEGARWAPTAHNMQNFDIIAVDDKKLLEQISKIKSPPSEEFIRENFKQLCFSEAELKKKKVGIMGNQFPPSWRDASKLDDAVREMAPTPLSYTIKGSPAILIVAYDSRKRAPASVGDVLGFLSLGCAMENMWLIAESLGIGFQIMSVFSSEGVAADLKKTLNIPKHMKIAFAVRLGYAAAQPNSLRVRRDLEDFAYCNQFGSKGI